MNFWTIAGIILLLLALAGLKIYWKIRKGKKEREELFKPYLEPEKALVIPATETDEILPDTGPEALAVSVEAPSSPEESATPAPPASSDLPA